MSKKLTVLVLSFISFLVLTYAESPSQSLPASHLAGTYTSYYSELCAKDVVDSELKKDHDWIASLILQVTIDQNGILTGVAEGKTGHSDICDFHHSHQSDCKLVSYLITGKLTEPTTLELANGDRKLTYKATLFFSARRGTSHAKAVAVVCPLPENYRSQSGSGHLKITEFYTAKAPAEDQDID